MEYDFVPNDLFLERDDFVHFQWTGSDYNPRRGCNNGEGGPPDPPNNVNAANQNSRADRSNIIDMTAGAMNYPATINGAEDLKGTSKQAKVLANTGPDGTPDMKLVRRLAYLGQTERLDLAHRLELVDPPAQQCQVGRTIISAIHHQHRSGARLRIESCKQPLRLRIE